MKLELYAETALNCLVSLIERAFDKVVGKLCFLKFFIGSAFAVPNKEAYGFSAVIEVLRKLVAKITVFVYIVRGVYYLSVLIGNGFGRCFRFFICTRSFCSGFCCCGTVLRVRILVVIGLFCA